MGCYGYSLAKTPVLDRLAEQGVLFERAYAPVPLTLPSHATMLTGLYPPEHGLHNNGQAALPQGLPTLATQLEAAGYETAAFTGSFTESGVNDTHTIEWDFGDGSGDSSGTLSPSHDYSGSGLYTVTLTVTDDDGGTGSDSLVVTVVAEAEAPPAASDLSARAKSGKINIVWSHVGAASYQVFRSSGGEAYEWIADTDSTYSVYADFGLTNGIEYCYKVRSVGADGQVSADSNEACATPLDRRRR